MILFNIVYAYSQDSTDAGMISLGGRNTFSFFGGENINTVGTGMGGQFRLRLSDRVNTEWYADILSSKGEGRLYRRDYHIGWSVFYYPFNYKSTPSKLLRPFLEGGHCFDHTEMKISNENRDIQRLSSAVQLGFGTHFDITERADLTVKSQYMMHLGTNVHAHKEERNIELEKHEGGALEGHLLVTISFNYQIFHLW
ncbi:MAG: hypothetical protein ABEH43_09400 [Flavobacteriales bacterium]